MRFQQVYCVSFVHQPLLCSSLPFSGCPKPGHAAAPAAAAMPAALPANMKAGDWICPHCSDHVYAYKSACGRCRTPKPVGVGGVVLVPGTGAPAVPRGGGAARPGDWICESCGDNVFASKVYCRW